MVVPAPDNSRQTEVVFAFERTETSITESFELLLCFRYGSYTKLQELCDETVRHKFINALGTCIVTFNAVQDLG